MRKLLTAVAILFILSPASGEVFHEITADEDSAMINTTVEMNCQEGQGQCPVNRWRITWDLPDEADIISIKDSLGEINDYERNGDQVSITSNSGDRRTSETIQISMRINREAEQIHKGLYKREFSLPGFKGEETSGYIQNEDIVSGWTGYGFQPVFRQENMSFKGEGSSRIRINFGEGNATDYYEFFGGKPENTSLPYEIAVGMTGNVQDFDRFPVALMKENAYEDSVVSWSSGEYVGGSFRMRKNLGEDFLPVMAHETVHGLNDRELKWDQTSSTWFDEGTSKYVESLVEIKLKGRERSRNLFGEDVEYTERRNGSRYRITLPSKGDKDELWNYYQENQDFMKYWNPSAYPDRRSFGYAYSELIVKNHLVHQNGSLDGLYEEIDPGRRIESSEEKWSFYSQEMDLSPCRYEEREKFNECIDEINSYDYKVYRAVNPENQVRNVEINPIVVPNRTEGTKEDGIELEENRTVLNPSETSGDILKTIISGSLQEGFKKWIDGASSLLKKFLTLNF